MLRTGADFPLFRGCTIQEHQFCRARGWLGEQLPAAQQVDALELNPRCVKDEIEEYLSAQRRTLFSGLSLVFLDTTSRYFEGEGSKMGKRGKSKNGRGEANRLVV